MRAIATGCVEVFRNIPLLLFLMLTLAVVGVIYLAQWAYGLRVRSRA